MSPQQSIAHYKILSKLGEGGMGAGYLATDTKLNREVAIKVLPESFAADSDRLSRFTREAQVLASLNHPNIAAIYGVEERALVMERVEGPTLAERIAQGPIPLDEALSIAKQLAEALEYAHERGVVHRDLKPANVKITPEGRLKVLDFGLAKAIATESTPVDPNASPTLTMQATQMGTILGTAAYMSPEQAKGKPVDRRADIWSFGVVVAEMLTGRQLYTGDTISETLAAVLLKDPNLSALPSETPPGICRLLRRCLEKDPQWRLQAIGDARIAIRESASESPAGAAKAQAPPALPWVVAAACALLTLIAGWAPWRPASPEAQAVHFQLAAPAGGEFLLSTGGSAISPDGHLIAYVATAGGGPKLWVRPLDSLSARELAGTENAQFPFWSPDSRSLGFFAAGKLRRIDISGGAPVVLADAPVGRGGAWNRRGTIIFNPSVVGGLKRIPASGGTATPLTVVDSSDQESSHRFPQFLDDDDRFIYLSQSADPGLNSIFVSSLTHPSQRVRLVKTSTGGAYVPPRNQRPGYLIWFRQGSLVAQPFYSKDARLTGEALVIPDASSASATTGVNSSGFSTSDGGTLVFSSGSEYYRLAWFNRSGKISGTLGSQERYGSLRIAPDATQAAVVVANNSGARDISTIDFARGVLSRISNGSVIIQPLWSPDGRRITYSDIGGNKIYERSPNGGPQETVFQSNHLVYPDDWSPDGHYLVYEELNEENHSNLWVLPRRPGETGERNPVAYLKTSSSQLNAQFSPDGKWMAYTSYESGQPEIFVQSFPASERRWQVSDGGGNFARWRRDGKELFYRALDGMLAVVSVRSAARGLEFSAPARLFRITELTGPHTYPYDVAADGQRILGLASGAGDNSVALTVLINWQAGLKPSF